jgi:TolB protein
MRLLRIALALLAVLLIAPSTHAADPPLPGRILFVKDGDLWVFDAIGAHAFATGGTFAQPSWSPDGTTLAFVYKGTNFADIFVTDDQGQGQTRLTTSQSTILDNNDWNLRPAWSPDGRTIAFVSDRATAFPTLQLMGADGSGRRALNTPGVNQEAVDAISWSPDGSQLAVTLYNEPGPTQIALVPMNAAGAARQNARVLTSQPGGALDPAWAPDGSWLAFAGHDGYATDIFAVRPDGTSVMRLTSDGQLARSPSWSPDGAHVAYLSNRTGYFELWVVDVQADASGGLLASTPRQSTRDLAVDAGSGISWGH